jgi:hypothetical protein
VEVYGCPLSVKSFSDKSSRLPRFVGDAKSEKEIVNMRKESHSTA